MVGAGSSYGLVYGDAGLLGVALIFIVAHVCWVGLTASLGFFTLNKLMLLRIPLADSGPPALQLSSIFTAAQNKMDGSQHSHTTNGGGEVLCDGDPSNASSATTTSQALSGLEIQGLKGQIPPSLT